MPHISYSQMDTASKCMQRWYFSYVEKIKRPPGIVVVEGRVPHVTAAKDLGHKMETGELLTDDVITDMARDALNEEWDKDGVMLTEEEKTVGEKKLRGRSVDAGVQLSEAHHKVFAPTIEPVAVERRFELAISGTDYTLIGYIDTEARTELGTLCIRDLKTTGKKPPEDAAAASQQLSIYALAIWAETNEIPQVALDFLIRRKVIGFDRQESTRDWGRLKTAVRRIESTIRMIDAGIINHAPEGVWWCSPRFCGYYDICPFV